MIEVRELVKVFDTRGHIVRAIDNVSTTVTAPNRFQVYQGSLPPADVPYGFAARAQPGGKVALSWQAVDLATAGFVPFGQPLPVVSKTLAVDLLDELADNSVWTPDKLDGLAVAADGDVYVVTDNDGLDDAVGQTVFLNLGPNALG